MALFPVRELIPEDFHLDPGQAPPVGPWLQDLAKVGTTLSDCKIGKYFHHGSRRFSEWLFLFCTGGQQRVGFLRRTKCLDLNSDYYYVLKCVTVSSLAGVFSFKSYVGLSTYIFTGVVTTKQYFFVHHVLTVFAPPRSKAIAFGACGTWTWNDGDFQLWGFACCLGAKRHDLLFTLQGDKAVGV